MKIVEDNVTYVEEIENNGERYVYDIELEDDSNHMFFANDILVHNTDSIYICLEPLLEKIKKWDQTSEEKKLDFVNRVSIDLKNKINNEILNSFAKEVCYTDSHFFKIKREIIGRTGFFLRKKRYVIWVIDDEGKKVNKLKKVGLELVRSNISRVVKKDLEEIFWDILKEKSEEEVNRRVRKLIKNLKEAPVEDIAIPIGLSKPISEYKDTSIPKHVRGAIWYNTYVAIPKGVPEIIGGNKILYLPIIEDISKNILGERIHVISFPEKCPIEEENIRKIIDWENVEERNVYGPLKPVYEGLKWAFPGKSKKCSLLDF